VTTLRAEVSVHRRICEIGRAAWDACASHPDHAANPFVAYDFLDIEVGRTMAQDLFIGAFNMGVHIDHTYDRTTLRNLVNQVFWDVLEGATYPRPIDAWVLNHGTALEVDRMDSLEVDDFFVFSRFIGILLTDSPDKSQSYTRRIRRRNRYRSGYGAVWHCRDLDQYSRIQIYQRGHWGRAGTGPGGGADQERRFADTLDSGQWRLAARNLGQRSLPSSRAGHTHSQYPALRSAA